MPESKHRRRHGRALTRGARSAGSLADARPRRKKVNKFYLAASVIIAVLVIAGFAAGSFGRGGSSGGSQTGSDNQFVEGVGIQQPFFGQNHLEEPLSIEYASFPPTSGDHWPVTSLVRCGFYEDGLRDERTVHHLEHSNIVVSYNLSEPAQVDQLREVIDDIGLANLWGITRFYDQIPVGQVAVAAWGVLDTFQGVDKNRIRTFFETYAGNLGPERPPVPCLGLGG